MAEQKRKKIIIDTDPGIDDTMAIFLAFNSPEVEVIGLTTLFGNVKTPMATANALHLLEIVGRTDVPVAEGSLTPLRWEASYRVADFVHGSDGLGNTGLSAPKTSPCGRSAAQLIVELARENPGEVTVIALASLTNVALALALDPKLPENLAGLVILGGAVRTLGNVNPVAEANIYHDCESADLVLGHFPGAWLVGLDVTHSAILTGKQLDDLKTNGGRFGEYVWSITQFYKAYHVRSVGLDGIYLHDPTCVMAAIRPELFRWVEGSVRVATEGIARGRTLMDDGSKNWVSENAWTGRPKIKVALGIDADEIVKEILSRLAR